MMSRCLPLLAVMLLISFATSACSKEEPKEPPRAATPAAAPPPAAAPAATGATSDIFRGEITVDKPVRELPAGETSVIRVKVKNTSGLPWPSSTKDSVRLSYHWLKKDGKPAVWDGERNFIPKALGPGEEMLLAANVKAPAAKGPYILEFDLVVDVQGSGWFSRKGSSTTRLDVEVK